MSSADAAQKRCDHSALSLKCWLPAASFSFFFCAPDPVCEKPNPAQQLAEMIHEAWPTSEQVIGHDYERFQAFVTALACSFC